VGQADSLPADLKIGLQLWHSEEKTRLKIGGQAISLPHKLNYVFEFPAQWNARLPL
jgi:hypothetical protein